MLGATWAEVRLQAKHSLREIDSPQTGEGHGDAAVQGLAVESRYVSLKVA
jgi:hypothetical protein